MNLKQLSCKHRLWTFPSLVDPPQINSYADAGERTLGAKMPTPFFFIASAFAFFSLPEKKYGVGGFCLKTPGGVF